MVITPRSLMPLAILLASCASDKVVESSATKHNAGITARTEFSGPGKDISPALYLKRVDTLDLRAKDHAAIIIFSPYIDGVQLSGGRCLLMNRGPLPERRLLGAQIEKGSSACATPPRVAATPRCADYGQGVLVGSWRLTCKRLPGRRSALVAIGNYPATQGRQVTLAVLDQDIAFVSDFALHDHILIDTLGRRADGKTVISSFLWNPAKTGL